MQALRPAVFADTAEGVSPSGGVLSGMTLCAPATAAIAAASDVSPLQRRERF